MIHDRGQVPGSENFRRRFGRPRTRSRLRSTRGSWNDDPPCEGPAEVACTNRDLDEQEWDVRAALPARAGRKKRHIVQRDGVLVAIGEHQGGTLVAEIDDGDQPPKGVPDWLDVLEDVSNEERCTGAYLARREALALGGSGAPADRSPADARASSARGSAARGTRPPRQRHDASWPAWSVRGRRLTFASRVERARFF